MNALSPIEDIIEDARNGRMYILVDAEDRENEGDLVIPAQFATPDAINFMARHGRGLICLSLSRARSDKLGLKLMSAENGTRHETAFTVSIEAATGVTTGISAHDRARTIAMAISAEAGRDDIVTPGHVFPLVARDGGVLRRAGHTEASVDISRLAGLNPSGVICEIMKDDGTMARLADLLIFAAEHGLKIGTIEDLIAYRRRHERLVERVATEQIRVPDAGDFTLHVYRDVMEGGEHVALLKGVVSAGKTSLVRMHKVGFLEDVLGLDVNRRGLVGEALRTLSANGEGVMIFVRETNPNALSARLNPTAAEKLPRDAALRDYGIGAQILVDLGVRKMELLTDSAPRIIGLDGFGLELSGIRPFQKDAAA
jgi:3,4-dihydroxy 2-butanone 4-phosphate synthase / GTP cyclohydrolase II